MAAMQISAANQASVASPSLHAVLPCTPPADALKKAKSQASGSDISDVASEAKDKAKGLLKGKGISALPANPLAAVADLNKDVRGDAEDYRDPAGAVQQDNAAGEACDIAVDVRCICILYNLSSQLAVCRAPVTENVQGQTC
jgi:hypothetical protein